MTENNYEIIYIKYVLLFTHNDKIITRMNVRVSVSVCDLVSEGLYISYTIILGVTTVYAYSSYFIIFNNLILLWVYF